MARVAPRVPELSEILCSQCGYVLNGLPESGNCPECGKPIADSVGVERTPPLWESASAGKKAQGFLRTSIEIILRPAKFYRTFTVRGPLDASRQFAHWHWWIASGLFAIAGATHAVWYTYVAAPSTRVATGSAGAMFMGLVIALTIGSYLCLDGITRLAGWLTTWEATYRGLRLPYEIVLRGMYYHAAHYLPVALGAVITTVGYQIILALPHTFAIIDQFVQFNSPTIYLYILSAQVVISAI